MQARQRSDMEKAADMVAFSWSVFCVSYLEGGASAGQRECAVVLWAGGWVGRESRKGGFGIFPLDCTLENSPGFDCRNLLHFLRSQKIYSFVEDLWCHISNAQWYLICFSLEFKETKSEVFNLSKIVVYNREEVHALYLIDIWYSDFDLITIWQKYNKRFEGCWLNWLH